MFRYKIMKFFLLALIVLFGLNTQVFAENAPLPSVDAVQAESSTDA